MSATADVPREVLHRVELSALGDLLRLRMNRDQACALEGADVRVPNFVERKVPYDDPACPVSQDVRELCAPLRPLDVISRRFEVGSAFGPEHIHRRIRL